MGKRRIMNNQIKMKNSKIYRVENENGTFESNDIMEVMKISGAEFSKKYTVSKIGEWTEKVVRDLDKDGNIDRNLNI